MSELVTPVFAYTLEEFASRHPDLDPNFIFVLVLQMMAQGYVSLIGENQDQEQVFGPSSLWRATQN